MSVLDLADYPWDAVAPYRKRAAEHPDGMSDLSIGSPVDPTPAVIQSALAESTQANSYPTTVGTDDLRHAIATWFAERRGVPELVPSQTLPTIGSKELVALLPTLLGLGAGDIVVHPEVAYPTYDVGARLVGATPLPTDDPDEWPASAELVWINSPGNPTGRVLDVAELRKVVSRARELGAIVASDECYAELGWDEPWASGAVPSILDPAVTDGDATGLLAVYSLSKQSNLAGYRAAFVAGDEALISQLTTARKHLGLMVPAPVQHAMTVALGDREHVVEQKARYRARREILRPALTSAGFTIDHSEAGLYLWASRGEDTWQSMSWLADRGILAGPGVFYGAAGEQHVRLALTATDEQIARAAERLAGEYDLA